MKYDFDHPVPRVGTYSMKYEDPGYFLKRAPGMRLDDNTIRLHLADMDFPCAPAITKAMHRVADFGTFGYTTADAAPEYRKAIISWYQRRFHIRLEPDWVLHCNGALDGIAQAIQTFSSPGDGVILCHPVYSNFTDVITRLGRKVAGCRLLCPSAGDYRMDWDKFRQVCARAENKVFILCSPANPVGRVWTRTELARMAEICRENGIVLVSDEIHSDIVRRGVRHWPVIEAAEDLGNIILVSGANKAFNLMGLHCAYCVIPDPKLRSRFEKDHDAGMPSSFAIAAMTAAYTEGEDWLNQLNEYIDESLAAAVTRIREKLPKARTYVPQGTYILWADFSGYGYTPEELLRLVNHEANVAVQNGLAHDPERGGQYLRFCLTSPKEVVLAAIERIAAAFDISEAQNLSH